MADRVEKHSLLATEKRGGGGGKGKGGGRGEFDDKDKVSSDGKRGGEMENEPTSQRGNREMEVVRKALANAAGMRDAF